MKIGILDFFRRKQHPPEAGSSSTPPSPAAPDSYHSGSGTITGNSPHKGDQAWLQQEDRRKAETRTQEQDYSKLDNFQFEHKYGLTKSDYLDERFDAPGAVYGSSSHKGDDKWLNQQETVQSQARSQEADYSKLDDSTFEFKYGVTKSGYLDERFDTEGYVYGASPHRGDKTWLAAVEQRKANEKAQENDYSQLSDQQFEFKYGLSKGDYLDRRYDY